MTDGDASALLGCGPFAPRPSESGGCVLAHARYDEVAAHGASAGGIYGLAAAASLALSAWGAWAQFIPNPDAALFLRAAELLLDGRWSDAVAVFRWPGYSLLIAGVMMVSGLEALAAAQLINALFNVVTTVTFIALCGRLGNGDRLLMVCAAIVIVLYPKLTGFRPGIIRDHGYYAFLLLTLYFVARDMTTPRLGNKLAAAATILAAGLFRIEGLYFFALVPLYYLGQQTWTWRRLLLLSAAVGATGMAAIAGGLIWSEADFVDLLDGEVDIDALVGASGGAFARVAERMHYLKHEFLYPFGGGQSVGAYIAIVISITVVSSVRAMSIPLSVMSVFAFLPRRLMPRQMNGFVLWFAFGQLPVLLVHSFLRLYLDVRHALGMTLILSVALAYLLAEMVRAWPTRGTRLTLPAAALTLVVTWTFAIPGPSKLGYLREAGEWIAREIPEDAVVLTNDARVAYYSRRRYDEATRIWASGLAPPPSAEQLAQVEYLAIAARDPAALPEFVRRLPKRLVRTFPGRDGGAVMVFATQ